MEYRKWILNQRILFAFKQENPQTEEEELELVERIKREFIEEEI